MAVVSTGFFDGVHSGHRKVIEALVSYAHSRAEEAVVVTFDKHPRAVLQQDARNLKLLNSTEEKLAKLKELGVDRIELLQFSKEFSLLSAKDYLSQILIESLGASALVLGYDNRIGSDKLGPAELASLASALGLELIIVEANLFENNSAVSSTKIRCALSEGRVEEASQMLSYDYALKGVVVPGKQLGRVLGFPTANMQMYDPMKILPSKGVYLTEVHVLGKDYWGMSNVADIVETHILDFDEDIYGLDIELKFKKRLRDTRRFESTEKLKEQLSIDEELCRSLCANLSRF